MFKLFDAERSRKGQITLFAIIGIVVVLAIGLVIYLTEDSKPAVFVAPNILVDEKFAPIQEYVQQCMNQIATDAVTKIGQHGGYIDPTDTLVSGTSFEARQFKQYDSDMAFTSPNDKNSGVVYWFYTKSVQGCDNCMVGSSAPSLSGMEWQVNQYVARNIDKCLQNFSRMIEMGYAISDIKKYDVKTTITNDGVAILMDSDILVKSDNQEAKLQKFYTELDIPLKKYYEIATTVAMKEAEVNFLENIGLYLITSYSGMSTSMLPPTSGSSEDYDITMWSKASSRQKFQELLVSYIPALRVPNTKNYVEVKTHGLSPKEARFYNATSLDFFNNTPLKNMAISFLYLGQDIYFDITPSDGEILKPTKVDSGDFSFMFKGRVINRYNFYYQVSYPVIVEIRDEYKPGSTFTFMLALEGTIKNNLKIADYYNQDMGPIYWDESFMTVKVNDVSTQTQPGSLSSYGVGSQFQQEYAGLDPNELSQGLPLGQKYDSKLFCNENQRVSGMVRLKAYDSVTELPLSDVNVKFGCGDFIECDVGSTIFNKTLQQSSMETRLPTCRNGYLKLSKQGYIPKSIYVSTDSTDAKNLGSVFLDPIVTKKISVKIYNVEKTVILDADGNQKYVTYTLSGNATSLPSNYSAIISVDRQSFDPLAEPYGQAAMLSTAGDYSVNETDMLFAPGTYAVNIQLLDHEGVLIPKECKNVCTKYNSKGDECKEWKKIPDSDIVMKPAPWGGISFENRTLLYVSPENLAQDNVLQFYVIRMPNPNCLDDMRDLTNIGKVSTKYKSKLLPRFVLKNETE